ncbi:MAG: hypothetical protein HZA11_14225 [Nitrospirae bacterium]|nr:hypothetical protein [Nitrospirota bacterium]
MAANNKAITYHYKFRFNDGSEKELRVKLDRKTLGLLRSERDACPEWAALKFFKCPNCPLSEDLHKFCPIAKNFTDIVESFGNSISYEEADVSVITEEREYFKHTTLQKALSSLTGIYMVTSGCPVMDKLRPMVRHHLPFASEEETTYRALSMYLLAQYFLYKRGIEPDMALKNLVRIYEDVQIVNKTFPKRLSNIKLEDANVNALVILNCFADSVTFSITKEMLEDIELLFAAYLPDEK